MSKKKCSGGKNGDVNANADVISNSERRKRKRIIRKTRILFRAIDVLYKLPQNSCPYVNKHNVKTIREEKDIVYAEDLGDIGKLDCYRDKTDKTLPAVILVHGGGFFAGDKKYRKGRALFFALHGFAVFCVNYGLAPDFIFPDPLKHTVAAANYIYDNAEKFNIDRNRIFVGGDSAGGYYAAMLAAFNCDNGFAERFGCAPKFKFFGALLNCGVYDMQTVMDSKYPLNIDEGVILGLTGTRSKNFCDYEYKDVCVPLNCIDGDFPPTFLIYSDNDTFCAGQGDVMEDKLNELGVYCESYVARDVLSNHCFSLTWTGEDAVAANELMLSFATRLAEDKIKLRR